MTKLEEIITNFIRYPHQLRRGSGFLAKRFKTTKSIIRIAKSKARTVSFNHSEASNLLPNQSLSPIRERKNPGVYVLMWCVHSPWYHELFMDKALRFIKSELNVCGLILGGDFMDCYSISGYDKGKIALSGIDLSYEYQESNKLLDEILKAFSPNVTKDYIYGNHEDRFFRIKKDVDIAKLGNELQTPTAGLKLIQRGFNVLENWKEDSIKLGNYLDIMHGEFTNVHSAKKHIDTYRRSIAYGHTHRFQIYVEGQTGGWNLGSMADFSAPVFSYATKAMKVSWNNAFAIITIDNDGFYHIQPILWINKKFVVNGKIY